MSTSTSHAEPLTVLRHARECRWLSTPPFDERMSRRIERTLADIKARLQSGTILLHRTLRISSPPRKVELEMLRLESDEDSVTLTPVKLAHGQRKDWENVCPDLIAVASELAMRWPVAARPDDIALMTDGCHLWFNPGRPDGSSRSWMIDHLDGSSPCAVIHRGDGPMPFDAPHTDANREGH